MAEKSSSKAKFRKIAREQQQVLPPGSSAGVPNRPAAKPTEYVDIQQEIANRRGHLENEDKALDIRLKRITLDRLFWFLTAETVLIFLFAFFQAVEWPARFHLEEWSFRVVVGATIAQITGMLYVAVRYLFPKNKV
jgi:hypothetical protein